MGTSKAQKYKTWTMILATILVLVVVGSVLAATGVINFSVGDDAQKESKDGSSSGGSSSGGNCEIAPTLSFAARDAQQQGTSVTTTANYRVNDVYQGTSAPSFSKGDKVQLLLNATGYIDVLTDEVTLDCGANKATLDGSEAILIGDQSDATMKIQEDSTTLTDNAAGGANNASAISAGGSDTYRVFFTGNDKDTTGDLLYVIEVGSTQNVSAITMSDLNGNKLEKGTVPDFYTNTLASPQRQAFIVPAIDSAIEKEYKLTFSATSGKTIGGAVYTTAYVGQPFVEDDGTFTPWGVEQEDGDIKYESTYDYDFFIASS